MGDSTPGNQDLYGFANLAVTPTTIFGVQSCITAKKSDAGVRSVKQQVRSGGTDYDGDTTALATDYETHCEIAETDPDTAVAWTESGVNAAELGVETV